MCFLYYVILEEFRGLQLIKTLEEKSIIFTDSRDKWWHSCDEGSLCFTNHLFPSLAGHFMWNYKMLLLFEQLYIRYEAKQFWFMTE